MKSFFIEHLTHQSHIIQIRRIPEKRRTQLEKFLVFFNQAWCTNDGYIIDIDQHEIPPEFADIAHYLQGPVMDDSFHRNLEVEEQLDLIFDQQERKFMKKIEEPEKREEEAKKREEEFAKKLAHQMKIHGASIEEIKKKTGLSAEEITSLLG